MGIEKNDRAVIKIDRGFETGTESLCKGLSSETDRLPFRLASTISPNFERYLKEIMGINGLWELVDGTQSIKTIAELAHEAGYSWESRDSNMLRIGVDMSVLFDECIAALHAKGLWEQTYGGPLLTFFQKLCQFLKVPVIFIFVFDGPERPSWKRGKNVNTRKIPWWTRPTKDLIESMGFNVHEAPGEAEAELANLSKAGHIDAVLSKDGDVIAFGALRVLRSIPGSKGRYAVYTADSILEATSYGPGGFLLLALMSGGDYSDGVKNCGVSVVTALVKCGFGDRLHGILRTLEGTELESALSAWLADVKLELISNSQRYLLSRQPALARRLTLDFLNPTARMLYTDPITTPVSSDTSYRFTWWIAREPDIEDVIELCMKHLGWMSGAELGEHLQHTLLEGLLIRALCSSHATYNDLTRAVITGNNPLTSSGGGLRITVEECHVQKRPNRPEKWARMAILASSARDIITEAGADEPEAHVDNLFVKVWVLVSYLPPSVRLWLAGDSPEVSDNDEREEIPEHLDEPSERPRLLDLLDSQLEEYCNSSTSGQKRKHQASSPEVDIDLTLEDDSVPSTSYRRVPAPFPMGVIDLTHSSHTVQDAEVIYISD